MFWFRVMFCLIVEWSSTGLSLQYINITSTILAITYRPVSYYLKLSSTL
jgi:hypothetical protein